MRCPGQDTRYWKEDAIFEVECPIMGRLLSFLRMIPQGNVQAVSECSSILGWILGVASNANTLSFALVNFQWRS